MKAPTFAEILNERIQKNKTHDVRAQTTASSTVTDTVPRSPLDSLELSHFHAQILENRPHRFKSSSFGNLKQTPYRYYKSTNNRQESTTGRRFEGDSNKPNAIPTSPSSVKETPRIRTSPHRLTDLQTKSMSYFISEKMFLLDDFTTDELKKAYRRLALRKHPDRQSGSNQFFIELQKHYKILLTVLNR